MTADDKSLITNMRDHSGEVFSEEARRIIAGVCMYGGWAGGALIFLYATLKYNPNQGHFAPQWVGFSFFFLLFIGIAGTLVRSRMRLSRTIQDAMRMGMIASNQNAQEIMQALEDQDR